MVATHESAPLAVVVQDLNKRSNNFIAEQVVRTLGAEIVGRPGNWDKGLEGRRPLPRGVGIQRRQLQMTNGSGLYDSNHFSAEQITTILRAASRDFRISAEFLASLAVAGTDGTIAHRMAGTLAERYVRAKTGTLANVSCLSGFAGSPGHVPLVFSILMNDVANADERGVPRTASRRSWSPISKATRSRRSPPAAAVCARTRTLAVPRLARPRHPVQLWRSPEQLRTLLRRQLLPTSTPAPLVHRIHPINRSRTDVTQLHRTLPCVLPLQLRF